MGHKKTKYHPRRNFKYNHENHQRIGPQDFLHQGKKCNQLSITTVTSLPQTPGVLLLPKRNRSRRQGGALIWWCDHRSGEELLEENEDSKGQTWLGEKTWGKLWKVDLDVCLSISLLFILTFVAVPGLRLEIRVRVTSLQLITWMHRKLFFSPASCPT